MDVTTNYGVALLAISVFAISWQGRLQGPPAVLSAIGWVIQALTVLAFGAVWVRC
jgi:hypothetical protein